MGNLEKPQVCPHAHGQPGIARGHLNSINSVPTEGKSVGCSELKGPEGSLMEPFIHTQPERGPGFAPWFPGAAGTPSIPARERSRQNEGPRAVPHLAAMNLHKRAQQSLPLCHSQAFPKRDDL